MKDRYYWAAPRQIWEYPINSGGYGNTNMTHHNYEIKGAFYRPPAKAILSVLPVYTPLTLRHDPYGNTCGVSHNDPNAIAIFVKSENIPPDSEWDKSLMLALAKVGFTEELLFTQDEWHLGYVPKEFAAKIQLRGDHDAHLTFWNNKPYITWETLEKSPTLGY